MNGEERPWGNFKVTFEHGMVKRKVITVMPKGRLSLQSHKHRSELWTCREGIATVVINDETIKLHEGESCFIPVGAKHRLSNDSNNKICTLEEIQIGDYLGEDDITRYEDIYGRS